MYHILITKMFDRFEIIVTVQYNKQPTRCNNTVSYGAEAWALTKKEKQALLIFERKIFRKIYGAKYENGEWKSRTNRELEEMSKRGNIVKWTKLVRSPRVNGGG